jgi:hypothetical protein
VAPRAELQTILEAILGSDKVYFQPPSILQYPCILYRRDDMATTFADNEPFRITKRYQVTVIDRNPDSEIPDKIALLPTCIYDRSYVADNLNHDVFNLFF